MGIFNKLFGKDSCEKQECVKENFSEEQKKENLIIEFLKEMAYSEFPRKISENIYEFKWKRNWFPKDIIEKMEEYGVIEVDNNSGDYRLTLLALELKEKYEIGSTKGFRYCFLIPQLSFGPLHTTPGKFVIENIIKEQSCVEDYSI